MPFKPRPKPKPAPLHEHDLDFACQRCQRCGTTNQQAFEAGGWPSFRCLPTARIATMALGRLAKFG